MTKPRILVVEDEAIIAADLQATLTRLGYEVPDTVDTGERAIARAAELRPDLVLMDIRLRGELDGIAAAEAIQRARDVPVIFLTAYTDEETLRRARLTLPFAYVVKPYQEAQLRTAIGVALDKHQHDAERARRASLLDAVLGSLASAVLVLDADGRIQYANRAARDVLDPRGKDLVGRAVSSVLTLDSRHSPTLAQAIARAMSGSETDVHPMSIVPARGSGDLLSCHVAPLALPTGVAALVLLGAGEGAPLSREARRARAALMERISDLV